MARNFPHLSDSAFPDADNIDVYKYANDFDYTRYDAAQMRLQLCSVPWDVGEVRVGQAIVPGLGNVVYFDSKTARDAYFAAIPDTECYRFETRFKELHRENKIDVPVPFDVAVKYNYLVVDYNLFANDDSPVMYEQSDGLRHWFYFIREVEFVAPNSTKLHLILDAWQTFVYDLDISGMVLERGHAPMQAMSADDYLVNPIDRCANLLCPDVSNENANYNAYDAGEVIFNPYGSCWALIITTANPRGSWGTKGADTWNTPAPVWNTVDGVPSWYCYCIRSLSQLSGHFNYLNANIPQFIQTIKAVCIVSSQFVTLGEQFSFANATCNVITLKKYEVNLLTLDKGLFGYESRYEQIAKLYTYPYSYIELSDELGNTSEIRIESMDSSTLNLISKLNIVSNLVNISAIVPSTGKGARRVVSFQILNSKTIDIKGNWYKYLNEWDVPTFGIVQSAERENDYSTHYTRKQALLAADNAKVNADDTATASRSQAANNAELAIDNADMQNTASDANNTLSKTRMDADVIDDNLAAGATAASANIVIAGTVNNQIDAENQRATLAASSAAITGGASAVTSALSGNIAGAVGAVVNAGAAAANAMMSAAISNDLSTANASLQESNNIAMRDLTQALNNVKNDNAQGMMDDALDVAIELTDGLASASAANTNANALIAYQLVTGKTGNIGTSQRNKDTAYQDVANQVSQAALNAPMEYGTFANIDYAHTRPLGLFAAVVTQDDFSIAYAGDEFLRHGYMFNRQWDFDGDWNVCKYFTYWKLSDIWTSNINIPDMYVDRIRYLLLGGVTVWRSPEYIGHKTIYENMDWS